MSLNPEIAEVVEGTIVNIITRPEQLSRPNKGRRLPIVKENMIFDPVTQYRIGPDITIEDDRVVYTYTVEDYPDAVERLADHLKTEVGLVFEKYFAGIKNGYTEGTVTTFDQQKEEAIRYEADNSYPTPLLDALAFKREIDKGVLVQKILDKSEMFSIASGVLLGRTQKIEDMIDAAVGSDDMEELRRIEAEEMSTGWQL